MSEYGAAALNLNITRDLSAFLARFTLADMPEPAVHAARRGVLDWIGCALAGSSHPTIATLIAVLEDAGGRPAATVLGHDAKLGLLEAPIANGQMGHILDYDDTHMGGVVLHASSPILSALFALADRNGATGEQLATAYAAGFEAGVRAGQASPGHHNGGWHLTGTLGSVAAGAAAGKLLGLNEDQMVHALGIATTQAAGMQQNRGTMCKSFHAGRAGANGVLAGLLAAKGFDSSDEIIEGKKGFCRIYSDVAAPELVLDELGERWEIARNGHKPYACGVVLHPAIDAMIELGSNMPADGGGVASIELRVNPAAVTITGVVEPETGLRSKFSIYHSAAVAFLDGAAGAAQYSDTRAVAPDVVTLRRKVEVVTDDALAKDQARAAVVLESGTRHETSVAHASGTVDNPMSDDAMAGKFIANAEPVIGSERAERVRDLIWRIETIPDVREIIALCTRTDGAGAID
ncbi:MAG: MmgE/PrpD family protein [Alphaproteobacteria bacterium]|nr:MmgE/PrpD family protein [Alphaproteobacteria bacterium]